MTTMTKHQTVLHWHEALNRDYRAGMPSTGPQMFVADGVTRDPYSEIPGTVVRLDYETWQDMGGPTEITVTVQPGDRLNSGQS